jgi:hypothetical protein
MELYRYETILWIHRYKQNVCGWLKKWVGIDLDHYKEEQMKRRHDFLVDSRNETDWKPTLQSSKRPDDLLVCAII